MEVKYMKVKELIELLQKHSPEAKVEVHDVRPNTIEGVVETTYDDGEKWVTIVPKY
jgi:hypothetical protein